MTTTTVRPIELRDMRAAIALGTLALHIAKHSLPAPLAIDLPEGDDRRPRVRVAGVADQMRWLNTVSILDQQMHPVAPHSERITWRVRLDDTGTEVDLVGLRGPAAVPA